MTPYDPPKPTGSNPAAYSAFLRNTGQSMRPEVSHPVSRGFCATQAARLPPSHCTPSRAPAKNVTHHHPQTANLCTAHQSVFTVFSLCVLGPGRDASTQVEMCSLSNHP